MKEAFYATMYFLISVATIGAIVMVTWNYTIPYIFGLPKISYVQAILLFFLSKMLLMRIDTSIKVD